MGTNTDTKLIEISPYMHQIGHSLNSREITRNVQEGLFASLDPCQQSEIVFPLHRKLIIAPTDK